MPAAPHPANEPERLAALRSLRVLDTPPEPGFDDLTEVAREALGMPIALVSLVDEHRQWFKSAAGLDACETPRSQSVCAHVVLGCEPVVIEDLSADERTSDNPLVTGDPGLRFYAGVPIVLSDGAAVGSFCVLDTVPRSVTPAEMGVLERLASACAALLASRRAEQELRDADRRLKAIQDAAPVALLHLEPVRDSRTRIVDFLITDANVMANRLLQAKDQALTGVRLFERLPEIATCAKGAVTRALQHTAASGDPTFAECDYADRRVRLSMRWKIARLDGRLVAAVEDITAIRAAERKVASRERLMRQFIEHTPVAVAMLDTDMRYLVAAARWYTDYDLDHDDLTGLSHYDVFPHIGEEWKSCYRKVLAGATLACERDCYVRPDGSVRWLRWQMYPWHDDDGAIGGIVICTEDITSRAEQDFEIERARDLLEQTQSLSGVGGWAVDLIENKLHWTEQTYRIHGLDRGDGEPDVERAIEFYAPEYRSMVRSAVDTAIANAEPFDFEAEIIRSDGFRVPVRSLGQPVTKGGRVVRLVGAFQDLTRIRAEEDERQRLSDMIRSITDASSDVIAIEDTEGRVLFGNPQLQRALGGELDDILGTNLYDYFAPASAEAMWAIRERVLETGEPQRGEESVVMPGTGAVRVFDTEKHAHRLPDGTIGGVITVARDITDVRAALEDVRTSEQRLSFALSAASVGFWDHNMVADRVYYADTWFTMLGYEPGELPMTIDCFWDRLLHPEDREVVRAAHDTYKAGDSDGYDVQCRLRHKSGSWHWIRDIGSIIERDVDGHPTRMVGVHLDVDQRKREQELLETALVAANEGLWEWSIPDNRCYFDGMWYKLLGYEPGELPMEFETWEALCHPDDLESAKLELGRYVRGEVESYSSEHRLWTKQGAWKWVLGTGKITERDEQGRPIRMVGVNMDIDDRMYAAETLEEALDAAEAANSAKSQFLANMSHEIRTPMTAIVGYAELMTSDPDLLADQQRMRETAAIVQRNGEHLLALINDILDLSKIDAGKMTTESVRTDLLEVINDTYELHRSRASHKGIRLEVQQRDALPDAVMADPVRIRQVLMNLVNNAIKFTESGSVTIRIETLHGDSRRSSQPPRLWLSVIDTGIGMTKEQIDRLFSAFEQVDDSMARRFGGTGLGLAISKRLAELMDGDVMARSRLGSGSTFTLDLPLQLAEDAAWVEPGVVAEHTETSPDAASSVDAEPLAGMRVLLVEDGLDNQRLISHYVTKAGATASVANNGEEGVELVASNARDGTPFDLVLMDMQMPVMDGYTAVRMLRAHGEHVPVVALTAHAMTGDRERCIAAGCDAYETKPVARQRLIEVCAQLLRQPRRAA